MSYQLSDLIEDSRLQRLFLFKSKPCALQLWILQIKKDDLVENRIVYGRLVPYSFFNNAWSFSDKDNSQSVDNFRASVTQLNLYIDSSLCSDLFRMICTGQSINVISEALNLKIPEKLSKQYGNTILINKNPIFRPVSYLVNRDSYLTNLLLSPHGSAGALSAAVSNKSKSLLFYFDDSYSRDLASIVLKRLKEDTGMDFDGVDIHRLGEIELLVFPTLDDKEKNLLFIERTKYKGLSIKFNSSQIPNFDKFQFHLSCENNNQVYFSKIVLAQSNRSGIFQYYFDLDEKIFKITDATKIDIFGFKENDSTEGCLCCSWRITYVKEINLRMQVIGNQSNSVKFDWLEKTVNSKKNDRLVAALNPVKSADISESRISEYAIDPWVEENQNLKSLFQKLNPPKSSGRFFLQWGKSDGEGRLQFVEWFKELISKHKSKHITIFDPYFEDVGLGLLTLYASQSAEYSIFRSLPKPSDPNIPKRRKTDNVVIVGLDNLLANCKQNSKRLQNKKIKIYGLKDGYLHDRYILVMNDNGLPVEGYHLSNSFQKATENYPLLVTPIPTDVLYGINQYTFDLIKRLNNSSDLEDDSSPITMLFDSKNISRNTRIYDPLAFLNNELAGKVLSVWLQKPVLKGLFGDNLIKKMNELGVIQNESFHDLPDEGLFLCLNQMDGELADFMEAWKVIGEILARTTTGDSNLEKLKTESKFLLFLSKFLSNSFQRNHLNDDNEVSVIDPTYFRKTLVELIQSSIWVRNFFQSTKYSALTWAEFYTIKCLWQYEPKLLIDIAERELVIDFNSTKIIELSLLGQIVSEISFNLEFNSISDQQLQILLASKIVFLRWLGWNALEQSIISSSDLAKINKSLANFEYTEKIQFIAWILNRNHENTDFADTYKNILDVLWNVLPEHIAYEDLETFIDAARGHMHKLTWSGLWLFRDIIQPLLDNKRIGFDDACKIWLKDFIEILELKEPNRPLIFSSEREGNLINISAYLWANSGFSFQLSSLNDVKAIFENQRRIVQRPLASTSNWSRWDEALKISMWISVFTKLCRYYLNQINIEKHEQLDSLLELSYKLVTIRSLEEWNSESDLIKFAEWSENLLGNQESISNSAV